MSEWIGCIPFNGDYVKEGLAKVCKDISAKDKSFRYRIYKSVFSDFQYVLTVYDSDKNHLWERLTWLKNKAYRIVNEKKEYLLRDQETPMWVREK